MRTLSRGNVAELRSQFTAVGQALAEVESELKNLLEIDLMPYHPLGESKTKRLGLNSKLNSTEFAERDECEKLRSLLESLCDVPVNMG